MDIFSTMIKEHIFLPKGYKKDGQSTGEQGEKMERDRQTDRHTETKTDRETERGR